MPGTNVKDTLDPVLINAATITTTTTHAAVQVNYPGEVRGELVLGAVTGTTPQNVLRIEASDDVAFGSGVVTLGTWVLDAGDASVTRWLNFRVGHRYVRAVSTVTGTTPSFAGVTLSLREAHFHRTKTDTA
jgi:hypothetical protein